MNCLKYEKYVLSFLMFSRLDIKSHIARVICKVMQKNMRFFVMSLHGLFIILWQKN